MCSKNKMSCDMQIHKVKNKLYVWKVRVANVLKVLWSRIVLRFPNLDSIFWKYVATTNGCEDGIENYMSVPLKAVARVL